MYCENGFNYTIIILHTVCYKMKWYDFFVFKQKRGFGKVALLKSDVDAGSST